jgi:DNA-binding transcriptional LysR family regulator
MDAAQSIGSTASLDDMALFVEVARAMSFRRAAKASGVPNSTLSRRISALEKTIGLRLLHRTTRRIELTEAGQLYFERCQRIVEEARLAHEQLGNLLAQPDGLLRVSMPVDFAQIFLTPLIAEFACRYPAIRFELDLTPRRVDLVRESVDMVIRMGEMTDSNLIARELGRLPRYLYASPRYLARAGMPEQPADLARHECLRMLETEAESWTLRKATETVDVAVGGRFRLNSIGMIRRLAALDLGIAVLAKEIAAEEVASGRLQRVLPQWEAAPIPIYAVTETRLLPAKTQRFIDFLREKTSGPCAEGAC